MELTTRELLQAMELGHLYQVAELAKCLGSSMIQVHEMLCELVADGYVRVSSDSPRCFCFERL